MLLQEPNCGCNDPVTPQPCTSDKCRKSLESTKIAELVWLQGLDEKLCERFQRVVDVLHLRDCAGNRISIDTPIVMCSDFKAQLCIALAGLAAGGEAVLQSTLLIGADCKLYTLPASGIGPGNETPNAVVDTTTIDFSATGVLNRTISGNVKLSADAGNELEVHADGLYAPEPAAVISACTQIQAFGVGSDAIPGTVVIGSDCLKHTIPVPEPLQVTDTSSIDLVLTGLLLSANLRLDPDSIGQITADGLEITCADVLDCAPPVTVLDTPSVNLSLLGQQVSADVIISPDAANALELHPNGLFVNVCAALDDGNLPVPAIIGTTVLVGADCNRYTLPEPVPIAVIDTTTVNLTLAGNVLQADINIQPLTLLSTGPQGLQVTCEAVQDCVFGTLNNFWTYDDIGNSVQFRPSTDAGNQLSLGTDGYPFVDTFPFSVVDSDCIDLEFNAGILSATPFLSAQAGNGIQCLPDGLFAPNQAGVTINPAAVPSNCIQIGVAITPGPQDFQISATPVISPDVGNTLECRPNGMFSAQALTPFTFSSPIAVSHVIVHNRNSSYPLITVWDTGTSQVVIPQTITTNDPNTLTITFFAPTAIAGTII